VEQVLWVCGVHDERLERRREGSGVARQKVTLRNVPVGAISQFLALS
jgi:hypothetical protein